MVRRTATNSPIGQESVSAAVVLDATPLGILCHPRNPPHVATCRQWLVDLIGAGRRVIVPEIADYEVRREFVRRASQNALINLDQLTAKLEYVPITTAAMRLAAQLWAQARNSGQLTAPNTSIDADVVLAAQALSLNAPVIVATANPAHLSRFVVSELWSNITP
jgi:predicted nucleic acid-binding protein